MSVQRVHPPLEIPRLLHSEEHRPDSLRPRARRADTTYPKGGECDFDRPPQGIPAAHQAEENGVKLRHDDV